MPTVSVIIPFFNVEKYLCECLDSVINQTLKDIEIICINDASLDNSQVILKEYSKIDSRIKVFIHDYNKGLGPTRNTGLKYASAPYISFVDSDDYIAHDYLEVLYNSINSENADLSWCGTVTISDSGGVLSAENIPEKIWTVQQILDCELLYPGILPVWNKMFKRELIKDIKQLPIVSEDQPVIAEYFSKCRKITTVNQPLYYYRKRSGTLSDASEKATVLWDSFFVSHKMFFDILINKNLSTLNLRKQAILRHFSMLWRIKSFNLINTKTWAEQEKKILKYLKMDIMNLKKSCFVFYYYLIILFESNFSSKIKINLVKFGIVLSRNVFARDCSIAVFPFRLLKIIFPYVKAYIIKILDYIEINLYKAIAAIYKIFNKKKIWLVGERTDTAQENGYYFYKYLKTEHPEEKSYYIINKKCIQYNRIKIFGDIINLNSLKHKILFLSCRYYLTSHNNFCFPNTLFGRKKFNIQKSSKNVFLQHGITQADVSKYYGKKSSSISMFICGAEPEYEYVKENFGYDDYEVKKTGFARFDGLHIYKTKRQILFMPTWRRDIWNLSKNDYDIASGIFLRSRYYKIIQELLTDAHLNELLDKYDYNLLFEPHYDVRKFIINFQNRNRRIIINTDYENIFVQDLLKESSILITDTSSVSFDFAYMHKPVLYFKFDENYFNNVHLKPGYFVHENMGFGEVINNVKDLVTQLEKYLKDNCKMAEHYKKRVESFFKIRDDRNCERIYNEVLKSN